jgi:colanic acid/amylovoran biosynthesis glycosyltransferase
VLANINHVFPVSHIGKQHLATRYGHDGKITVAKLGVKPQVHMASSSKDGTFRIVSCSSIIPVKRLALLAQALACLPPELSIHWHHIGDGTQRQSLEALCQQLPINVKVHFMGAMANADVMAFYQSHPIDVFVNVSASEGIPVSMMEAQSVGIPILATAVGGVPEIVGDANGLLLPPNPLPQEIANGLLQIANVSPAQILTLRHNAWLNWQTHFNADNNYTVFCQQLAALLGLA